MASKKYGASHPKHWGQACLNANPRRMGVAPLTDQPSNGLGTRRKKRK